jgi:1-hydroxycarotenoid 3,4-desaturase
MITGSQGQKPNLRAHHVVVVGAGIGGLVSALLLASKGLKVTVVEKASVPGGKMRQVNGVDSGPTVFTMRWILDQVFASVGAKLEDHLKLYKLDVLARHAWAPKRGESACTLDLFANRDQTSQAIAQFSSPMEAKRFDAFCKEASKVYRTLEAPYIRSERPSFLGITKDLGPSGLATLASLGPFAGFWRLLGQRFTDPRLQQLFGRYATYCGASPWAAPATLMLIADVEMQGVWGVEGGMTQVARAVADLAAKQGVEFLYDTQINQILVANGRASGVRTDGEQGLSVINCDSVVFNGDSAALAQGHLGADVCPAVPKQAVKKRSLSAVTYSVKAATSGFDLSQHNVFFTANYREEFRDVFERHRLPRAGTVYVCAQDRRACDVNPIEQERLLLLVNAPPIGDLPTAQSAFNQKEIELCTQTHFNLLKSCGLEIDLSKAEINITTPEDFNQMFPATGGALYGQASHGWMSQFSRMGAVSRIPGLYLAGGSVHPGPGVPMAAMSGQLAAETLMAHLDSTKKLSRVVIAGGMSMPSAIAGSTG